MHCGPPPLESPLPLPSTCPPLSSSHRILSRSHRSITSDIPPLRRRYRIFHDKPRPHRSPVLPNIETRIAHPPVHQEFPQRLENPADQLMGKALEVVLNCDGDAVGVVVEMEREVKVGIGGAVLSYGSG